VEWDGAIAAQGAAVAADASQLNRSRDWAGVTEAPLRTLNLWRLPEVDMKVKRVCIALFLAIGACATTMMHAAPQCPRGINGIPYRNLGLSQIGLQVMIDDLGPFEFIIDTGAQITVLDPAIAARLGLRSRGTVGVLSVSRFAQSDIVDLESISIGPYRVAKLSVALQDLDRLRSSHSEIHGILGLDFLMHFDLLIDNAHRLICLDESREMQAAILGDRIGVVRHDEANASSRYVAPVLVPVHLPGDREQNTVLRVDSGSSAPLLFSNRGDILPWLQKAHASSGNVSGTSKRLLLAALPAQSVRIANHLERQIVFLTPIGDGSPRYKEMEDGLLPTALFKEVLISFRDGFVVFNPHDACPQPQLN